MKKTILVVLVALIGFGTQQSKAQLEFGVVAGMNVSKADFKKIDYNLKSENRCGWFIGPKVEFAVPLVGLGFDASLQYSQRTLNVDDPLNGTQNEKLNTIEVPINLRYQFGFSSVAAAYLATGPQFGFNVGDGKFKDITGVDYKVSNSVLTWNIGAGVKLLKHLEVGVGYNIALSKFAKYTGTQESSLKGNTFQVHVGYFF
ncbi:MAG: porin family protein [Bacteroidaceae bacterium]|nr:porin family protein [Bacteroidaceae bacterium]MBR4783133.1 porin family protein [Bacteroidaceae bacterium]